MAESVPVRCPACRREHLYAAPSYPCACGAPVSPALDRRAAPFPVTEMTWDEEWITVRCGACGREDQWPAPELGCPCGTVLRVPTFDRGPGDALGDDPTGLRAWRRGLIPTQGPRFGTGGTHNSTGDAGHKAGDTEDLAASAEDEAGGTGNGAEAGADGRDDTAPTASTAGTPPADTHPDASEAGTNPPADPPSLPADSQLSRPADTAPPGPSGDTPPGPSGDTFGTSARRDGGVLRGSGDTPPGLDGGGRRKGDDRPGVGRPAPGVARRAPRPGGPPYFPAHVPAPRSPRPAFQPITIRTARDAVTAAALYLRWLGYKDIRRADQRPPNGVGLAARGILAQVDPSVNPASLRDIECLWLTAMTESARCVYFSLAGYDDGARSRADGLRIPLFVLDLTGTPQPVNSPADELVATGA